ncbi:hypothetical protein Dimus_038993 [Dionaea muscipula]
MKQKKDQDTHSSYYKVFKHTFTYFQVSSKRISIKLKFCSRFKSINHWSKFIGSSYSSSTQHTFGIIIIIYFELLIFTFTKLYFVYCNFIILACVVVYLIEVGISSTSIKFGLIFV